MSDIVEKYKIGKTCPYYDINSLKDTIVQLSKLNEIEKKKIMERAQSLFLNNYSWEKSRIILKRIYDKEREK